MTQEIIEMARQSNLLGIYADEAIDSVTRFAKLVAAKEREACLSCYSVGDDVTDWVDKILARGEA